MIPLLMTLTSALLTFIGIRWIRSNASKLSLLDIPNERSAHQNITPRGAGLAFLPSLLIPLMIFYGEHLLNFWYIYASLFLVWIIGVIDDMKGVSPNLKFVAIFLATVLLFSNDTYIGSLGKVFGFELTLPSWFAFVFTFFAISGYTNALNLIDGLDGLAASVSLVILIAFAAVGYHYEDELILTLSLLLISILLIFLFFNWHPASIFMGDSGSLLLGMGISLLAVKATEHMTPVSIVVMIMLPILDTFVVMTRRKQRSIPLFKADKNHIHHFLMHVKGDVAFVVSVLVAFQAAFSIIGYQSKEANNLLSLILVALFYYLFLSLFDQRIKRRSKIND